MIRQTTRLPEDLHTWLADRAKENHRSLNAELINILTWQKHIEMLGAAFAGSQRVYTQESVDAVRASNPGVAVRTVNNGVGQATLTDGTVLYSTDSINWTTDKLSGTQEQE